MSTNVIFNKLKATAEDNLARELRTAWLAYHKAIGLSGTCEEITLKDRLTQVTITTYTNDVLEAISKQLFEKRKEARVNKEIQDFLTSVSTLSSQFKLLEELNLDG